MGVVDSKEVNLQSFLNQCIKTEYSLDPRLLSLFVVRRASTALFLRTIMNLISTHFFLLHFSSSIALLPLQITSYLLSNHLSPDTTVVCLLQKKKYPSIASLCLGIFSASLCNILSHIKQSWDNLPASRQDCLYLHDLSNLLLKLY